MSSIFVQIGSYHDEELLPTIKNMIDTSSGDNIINFGIHNSFYKFPIFTDDDLKSINKNNKISVKSSAFPNNLGMGVSRYIANNFYDGEKYYLQTDSHMRFCNDWDNILIENHNTLTEDYGFNKLIISSYPSHYSYEKLNKEMSKVDNIYYSNPGHGRRIVIDKGSEIESFFNDILNLNIDLKKLKYFIGNTYVSGAYIFTSGEFHSIIPNKQILHRYDEMLTGFRAYTHGYDVMPPRWEYCYHLYRHSIPSSHDDPELVEDACRKNRRRFPDYDALINNYDIHKNFKNIEEIKDIILNNRIDDQGFGTERDFQDLIKKLK